MTVPALRLVQHHAADVSHPSTGNTIATAEGSGSKPRPASEVLLLVREVERTPRAHLECLWHGRCKPKRGSGAAPGHGEAYGTPAVGASSASSARCARPLRSCAGRRQE